MQGANPTEDDLKYKVMHELACDTLVNFMQLLLRLQNRYKEFGKLDDETTPDIKEISDLVGKFSISGWINRGQFSNLHFIRYLFQDFGDKELILDADEVKILEQSKTLKFVESFRKIFNEYNHISEITESLKCFVGIVEPKSPPQMMEAIDQKSKLIREQFETGNKKIESEIEAFYDLFGRKADSEVEKPFENFIFELSGNQELQNLISECLKNRSFKKEVEELLENDAPEDTKDLQSILDLRAVVNFLKGLRRGDKLEDLIRTRNLETKKGSDPETSGGSAQTQTYFDLLLSVKEKIGFIKDYLNESLKKTAQPKKLPMKKIIRTFNKNCEVTFDFDVQEKTVQVVILSVASESEKEFLNFVTLLEIRHKARIYLKEEIFSREDDEQLFIGFENTMNVISNYKNKLLKFLELGIFPNKDFLTPIPAKRVYSSTKELNKNNDYSNLESSIAIRPLSSIKSLSEKLLVMDYEIVKNKSFRKQFLEKISKDENYFGSIFLEKNSIDFNKTSMFHLMRSIAPRLEWEQFERMHRNFTQKCSQKHFETLKKLKTFFNFEKDTFRKAEILGKDKEDRNEDSLKFVVYNCPGDSEERLSEWALLNRFVSSKLKGEMPPLIKFFFCEHQVSFDQIEPFIFRSVETEDHLPYVLVGFSNLMVETQKKCLDLYKVLLKQRSGNVLLLFDYDNKSTDKLLSNYSSILDKVEFEENVENPPGFESNGVNGKRPSHLGLISVFKSVLSGNGKSFEISRRINGEGFECFQLSPSVEDKDLSIRFARLLKRGRCSLKHVVFKIEELADKSKPSLFRLSKLLFALAHFRVLECSNFLFTFSQETRLYFEFCSASKESHVNRMSVLDLFPAQKCTFSVEKLQIGDSADTCQIRRFAALYQHLKGSPEHAKDSKEDIKGLIKSEVLTRFENRKPTFRKVENYLRYVNFQLQVLTELREVSSKKKSKLVEYFLMVGLEMVLPSADVEQKQNMAYLRHGLKEVYSDDEDDEEQQLNFFSEISHAYIFHSQKGLNHIFQSLDKNNKFDRILLEVLQIQNSEQISQKNDSNRNFDLSEDQYLHRLCECLGKTREETEDIITSTRSFNGGKGYCLNKDNLFKILLIHKKVQVGLPVFLMGETGCGKTYLLEYFAEVLHRGQVDFETFVLHAGVTQQNLRDFLLGKIQLAKQFVDSEDRSGQRSAAGPKEVWVFFDEINTSKFEKILADLIIDRQFYFGESEGRSNPQNSAFPRTSSSWRRATPSGWSSPTSTMSSSASLT